MNRVLRGELDPRVANALGYLASIIWSRCNKALLSRAPCPALDNQSQGILPLRTEGLRHATVQCAALYQPLVAEVRTGNTRSLVPSQFNGPTLTDMSADRSLIIPSALCLLAG